MANIDLTDVIEDAVNDSVAPDPVEDTSTDVEASSESTDTGSDDSTDAEVSSSQVPSPGSRADNPAEDAEQDDFAKKFGIASKSVTGNENRIPYSRVKKIVARAEQEGLKYKTELETIKPKYAEYETKVRDYEDRLSRVAQFEQVLENDPKTFLNMLSQVPAYKEFFDYIGQLASGAPAQAQGTAQQVASDMPQPGPDGLYDMEGLKSLLAWQAKQVEESTAQRVTRQIEQRYAPIEKEWQTQQQIAQAVPVIQQQIAEARTWPQFNESEAEIVAALQANPKLDLNGAYRQVVFPKLQASRDDMRKSILAEIRQKPANTAAGGTATKPGQVPSGPRNLEDVVREAVATLK